MPWLEQKTYDIERDLGECIASDLSVDALVQMVIQHSNKDMSFFPSCFGFHWGKRNESRDRGLLRCEHIDYPLKELFEQICSVGVKLDQIDAIVGFGSAFRGAKNPDDLDIMVVTNAHEGLYHLTLPEMDIRNGGYGSWWGVVTRKHALHLFVSSGIKFHEALEAGESEPKNIIREGVLIYGQFGTPREAVWYGKNYMCDCR